MAVTNSPNMNLPVPVVGSEAGPDYATDINNSLNIVDAHSHVPGSGVPITPSAININTDLPLNNNGLTATKNVTFQVQSAPSSTNGTLSESGVDLYYTDGNGNKVRITNGGSVAGTTGSISGLSSPASATYVSGSQTFVWQSGVSTPANMDAASIIIRELVSGGKGVTLSPIAGLASNYTLTLPTLPASQKIMTLDASGNISAPYGVDNSTIVISANNLKVADSSIGTTQLANLSVTAAKIALATIGTSQIQNDGILGVNIDANTVSPRNLTTASTAINVVAGPTTFTSTAFTSIASVTVTTVAGRPVILNLCDSNTTTTPGTTSALFLNTGSAVLKMYEGSSPIGGGMDIACAGSTVNNQFPYSMFNQTVIATATGSTTYSIRIAVSGGSTATVTGMILRGIAI